MARFAYTAMSMDGRPLSGETEAADENGVASELGARGLILVEAKRLGDAFAVRGIAVRVVSSPMCRCTQTATIAFGERYDTDPLLREVESADTSRVSAFEAKAQSLIAAARGPGPVVFVSHRPNIAFLTMELVDEGELLVATANEKGELDVIGRLRIPDTP